MPPLEGQFNNFSAFWKLLENSPHLAEYVHNLEMGLSVPSTELVGSPEILAPASWKAIEDMLYLSGHFPSANGFFPVIPRIQSSKNWVPQHNWRVDDMTIELWNEENMAMRALHRIALGVLKSLTIILSGNVDHTPFFELSSLSHIPTLHLLFDGNRIGQATVTTWLQAAMGDHAQFTTTLYNLQLSNPTLYLQTDETYFSSSSGDAYLRERTYISVQDR
ncbi:hypothetical protein C8R45DRAFT_941767 [Mycena sanguinolenta]|nr:hypothetical protein C8R45DRAFT_941767 [Mycena sanguinolenta]